MVWTGWEKVMHGLLASDPARTLLKEDKQWNEKDENKTSENVLIKGDNLEVLKHLSNAYFEKAKMIYLENIGWNAAYKRFTKYRLGRIHRIFF